MNMTLYSLIVRCSRQVALSRIRNVIVKEKQSRSMIASEQEIRRSRLRTIEIEAAMARASIDSLRLTSRSEGLASTAAAEFGSGGGRKSAPPSPAAGPPHLADSMAVLVPPAWRWRS